MPSFFNRPRLSPDFIAVPAEPSGADLAPEIDRTEVLAAFDRLVFACHCAGRPDLADRVLDERTVIAPVRRPTVPVIPGRPS